MGKGRRTMRLGEFRQRNAYLREAMEFYFRFPTPVLSGSGTKSIISAPPLCKHIGEAPLTAECNLRRNYDVVKKYF